MKLAPRWKVLLHAIRIFGEHMYDGMVIYMDGKDIQLHLTTSTVMLIDAETGEILLELDEDGTPFNSTEWANAEMNYDVPNEYPMYDYKK